MFFNLLVSENNVGININYSMPVVLNFNPVDPLLCTFGGVFFFLI